MQEIPYDALKFIARISPRIEGSKSLHHLSGLFVEGRPALEEIPGFGVVVKVLDPHRKKVISISRELLLPQTARMAAALSGKSIPGLTHKEEEDIQATLAPHAEAIADAKERAALLDAVIAQRGKRRIDLPQATASQ